MFVCSQNICSVSLQKSGRIEGVAHTAHGIMRCIYLPETSRCGLELVRRSLINVREVPILTVPGLQTESV
jgi:hypothetical protein